MGNVRNGERRKIKYVAALKGVKERWRKREEYEMQVTWLGEPLAAAGTAI